MLLGFDVMVMMFGGVEGMKVLFYMGEGFEF